MCSILEAIKELELPAETKTWIAFSGGLDSTVLLHACVQVLGSSRCRVLHINHQLNPLSDQWVAHCKRITKQWGVNLVVTTVDLSPGNIEQQARLSRYAAYRHRLGSGEHLLTAHHRDDDIETLSWQLFTGRALIGIPKQRRLGSGTVSRPLLDIERQEIESYANHNELTWIEDESNEDTSFDRNWLRLKLLPQVFNRFSHAKDRMLELKHSTLPIAQRQPLNGADTELTVDGVRSWLLAYDMNPPTTTVKEILTQKDSRTDASPEIRVAEGVFVRRFRNQLHLVRDYEVFKPLTVTVGESISLSNGTLSWVERTEGFARGLNLMCTNRTHLPSGGRGIRQGDLHKKFANLFQEFSIPPWLRDGWPALCEGDSVVSLVDVIADKTADGWQTKRALMPEWHPYD